MQRTTVRSRSKSQKDRCARPHHCHQAMRGRGRVCVYERERESVCVCVCTREGESVCVCVCVYERECVCVCAPPPSLFPLLVWARGDHTNACVDTAFRSSDCLMCTPTKWMPCSHPCSPSSQVPCHAHMPAFACLSACVRLCLFCSPVCFAACCLGC